MMQKPLNRRLIGVQETTMSDITIKELEKQNGRDGAASFVAVNGEVYDVSECPTWEQGDHMGIHQAGCDLTAAIADAPHGMEVFERVKKAGRLVQGVQQESVHVRKPPAWASMLIALHSHPITVHFPQAFFVFAPLFLVLFYVTGVPNFERTAYYLLWTSFLVAFPSTATGFLHWWYKYSGKSRPVFKFKIVLSLLLIPVAGITLAVHAAYGVLAPGSINWFVLLLYAVMVPIIVLLGRAGGLIVFEGRGR